MLDGIDRCRRKKTMSVLDVKGLSFAYPNGKNILHAIDLTIAEGEFILLCGPSGCG